VKKAVRILGTGSYLPERVVTNQEIIDRFESNRSEGDKKTDRKTRPESLKKLLGAETRHAAASDEESADLVAKAAKKILGNSGIAPERLTRIIVTPTSSSRGEHIEPAVATFVQQKIGATCPAFDLRSSCPGWLLAVESAAEHIILSDNDEELILVVGSALMSRDFSIEAVQHGAIFGDGASGVILGKSKGEESCIYGCSSMTLGQYSHYISLPREGNFYMEGGDRLTKLIRNYLETCLNMLWSQTGFGPKDVDFAVIHQPTVPIFETAVEVSGVPSDRVAKNYSRLGNTISAELPITLDEAVQEGRIKRGDKVLLLTFGAGITGASMLLKY